MSSFYRQRQRSMGFVWLAPVMEFVGGALQSHPVAATGNPYMEQSNTGLTVALALGGLAVIGGAFYFVMVKR